MSKEKLRNILNYAGNDKAEYEKVEAEIYEHDRKRLEVYSAIALLLLIAVIMFALFYQESGLNYNTYLLPALAIPLLFVVKPWKIILSIVFYTAVFIILCVRLKSPALYFIDIIDALIFALAGSIASFYVDGEAIENLVMKNRMKELSEIDGLTGFRNRTAYEAQLKPYPLRCKNSLACIYIDANGLHELNEKEGHFAGDRMLIKVATLVQETFGRNDSFRIGGDEYVAFVINSNVNDIINRIRHVTQEAEKNSYHVSAGYSIADKDNIDIKKLIQEAEEVMYSVKTEYYKTIGNRRCR